MLNDTTIEVTIIKIDKYLEITIVIQMLHRLLEEEKITELIFANRCLHNLENHNIFFSEINIFLSAETKSFRNCCMADLPTSFCMLVDAKDVYNM